MTGTDLTKKEASGLFFGQNARILLTLIGCVALYCAVPTMVWAGDENSAGYQSSENSSYQSSENSNDGTEECPHQPTAQAMFDAEDASFANETASLTKTFKTVTKAVKENPMHISNIGDEYCISADYAKFFETLIGLLEGLDGVILGIIKTMIETLLEKVCEYVATGINSLLEMICIPLPDISLPSFSLPGFSGTSCDGISLADFVTVSSGKPLDLTGKLPDKIFSNILTRDDIPENTELFKF